MRQYEMFEITLRGPELKESWARADVRAVFTHEGKTVTVPGFYAGEGVYKVRFLPMEPGEYVWHVSGAVIGEGREECVPAVTHGPVRSSFRRFASTPSRSRLSPRPPNFGCFCSRRSSAPAASASARR